MEYYNIIQYHYIYFSHYVSWILCFAVPPSISKLISWVQRDDHQALHARDGTDRMWVNVVPPSFAYIIYIYTTYIYMTIYI